MHTSSTVQVGILSHSSVARFIRLTVFTSSVTLPVIRSMQSQNLSQLPGSMKDTSRCSTILSMASLRSISTGSNDAAGGLLRIRFVCCTLVVTVGSCRSQLHMSCTV